MISREKIIDSLNSLPDKVSLDEILDRIFLLYKVEEGVKQSENEKVHSTDEVREKLSKWLK